MAGRNLLADDSPVSAGRNLLADDDTNTSNPMMRPTRSTGAEYTDAALAGIGDIGQNLVQNYSKLAKTLSGVDIPVGAPQNFSNTLANIRGQSPQGGIGPGLVEGLTSSLPSLLTPVGRLSGVGLAPIAAKFLNAAVPQALVTGATSANPLLAGSVAGIGAGVIPAASALFSKSILGQNIGLAANAAKTTSRSGYTSLLNDASNAIQDFKVPSSLQASAPTVNELGLATNKGGQLPDNISYLLNNTPDAKLDAFKDFLNNPSAISSHRAQSELGVLSSRLKSLQNPSNVDRQVFGIADDLRGQIRNTLMSNLENSSQPELAGQYQNLSDNYKNNVLPFNIKAPREGDAPRDLYTTLLKNGDLTASNVADKFLGLKRFPNSDAAGTVPGYQFQQSLNNSPLLKKLLGGAAVGLAVGAPVYSHYSQSRNGGE